MSHAHEYSDFGEHGDEPGGTARPTVEQHEAAMRLMGAAGSPNRAAKIIGLNRQTLFRVARRDLVLPATLDRFDARIAEAEAVAEIISRARLEKVCGIPGAGLTKQGVATLKSSLGESEAALLARELGFAATTPRNESFRDRMLARAPVENREFVRRSLATQKKEKQ